ncbi:glycosyltransferase involved in cell wall biosynthesis [Paenibacillus anaericanus]|uniref:glycosyltransferase family 2 protein n=1 Tax=Paenibacillus anaericanus TaxID=170367 RepID=UPI002784BA84|nr:glycosyltransferase [Paenibacillus anaericanus]MDQ0087029.1 glycosyltransferase involved in cell wall biosynthesis [Paenibacillus anaericanus]
MKSQKLSLCMIVKNEEKWLARCLESVKDVVDEIIIVDTGSNDQTKEIALGMGAMLYDYEWNDHFADARNYGLELASGDWVLWLDADEEVDEAGRDYLRNVLLTNECYLGRVQMVNYYGSTPHDYNRSHLMAQYRLFRNDQHLRFRGAIHEQLNIEGLKITADSVTVLPVIVHHFGYLDETVQDKEKMNRNLRLLEKERRRKGYDPWVDYHLASELYRGGKLADSFENVNLSIRRFIETGKKPPSLLYNLKYTILIGLGSFEGAWPGIDLAIQLYPDYVDLHLYKGIILMRLRQYDKALEAFNQCLRIKEVNISHLTMVGAGSFYAWYYIGYCYQELGDLVRAEEAYRMTLELSPNHLDAQEALRGMGVAEFTTRVQEENKY